MTNRVGNQAASLSGRAKGTRTRTDEKGRLMGITFPNESEKYRSARDHLLQSEIEMRRAEGPG